MPKYNVRLPVSAVFTVMGVEAADEDEAITKAMDTEISGMEDLDELQVHEKIVDGNVCNASLYEAEVEEEDED